MTFFAVASSTTFFDKFKLLYLSDQRYHDFRNDVIALVLPYVESGFDNGSGLHFRNFGISHGQTAAAVIPGLNSCKQLK